MANNQHTEKPMGLKNPPAAGTAGGMALSCEELTDLTNVIARAAAWVVRQCFPPSGRHRARPPVREWVTNDMAALGGLKCRKARPESDWLSGDTAAAMVRPYFLAHEKTRPLPGRTLLVCAQGVRW